jgi:hypothetical protein
MISRLMKRKKLAATPKGMTAGKWFREETPRGASDDARASKQFQFVIARN